MIISKKMSAAPYRCVGKFAQAPRESNLVISTIRSIDNAMKPHRPPVNARIILVLDRSAYSAAHIRIAKTGRKRNSINRTM